MKNHSTNILTASGTSSCSECIEKCCQRRCNKTCLHDDQCNEFINDRTYTILRKICQKIFKDYNRSQCREKYTIFDGGNSINVRIHRSGSRGDGHTQYSSNQDNASNYRISNRGNNNVIDQYNRHIKEKSQRNELKIDSEVDSIDRLENISKYKNLKSNKINRDNSERIKSKKQDERERENEKDNGDLLEKMDRKSKYVNRTGEEQKLKRKRTPSETVDKKRENNSEILDNEKTRNQRIKKGNVENTSITNRASSNIRKRGLRTDKESDNNENQRINKGNFENISISNEIPSNSKKRGLRPNKKSNINENEENSYRKEKMVIEKSKKSDIKKGESRKLELNKNQRDMNIEMSKRRSGKVKNKYNEYFDDEDEINDNENYAGKTISRKGNISNRKGDLNSDFTGKHLNKQNARRSKGYGKNNENKKINKRLTKIYSQRLDSIKSGKFKVTENTVPIITDLRNKVRRSDKLEEYENIMNQKAKSLNYSPKKFSRADEIKASDYLRAHMEERDLCRLRCPSQINPCVCFPSSYPNISCFSEICKC